MKRNLILLFVLLLVALVACQSVSRESVFSRPAGKPIRGESRFPTQFQSDLDPKTDIHFNGRYCLECHEKIPITRRESRLRYEGDFQILCRCHYKKEQIHVHPVSASPTSNVQIPAGYPLEDGKLTCLTCHNIYIQCQDNQTEKLLLKGQDFLRGSPYENKLDICFKCHDKERYRRYNPHRQLAADGKIIEKQCLYCHTNVPDVNKSTQEEVKLIGTYGALCMGCHFQAAKQPLHVRHIRKPSARVIKRMQQMQEELKIVLPLDSDGKITCVTCHNPHQQGLIPSERSGAKGAGEVHRHRLSGNMCIKCHPMT